MSRSTSTRDLRLAGCGMSEAKRHRHRGIVAQAEHKLSNSVDTVTGDNVDTEQGETERTIIEGWRPGLLRVRRRLLRRGRLVQAWQGLAAMRAPPPQSHATLARASMWCTERLRPGMDRPESAKDSINGFNLGVSSPIRTSSKGDP